MAVDDESTEKMHSDTQSEPTTASKSEGVSQAATPEPSLPSESSVASSSVYGDDRFTLLERARAFLTSPQLRYEEPAEKRRFLAEKGLNAVEIEGLMRELVRRQNLCTPSNYYLADLQ